MGPHHVRLLVMMLPDQQTRRKIFDSNRRAGLKVEAFRSVNGYNRTETAAVLGSAVASVAMGWQRQSDPVATASAAAEDKATAAEQVAVEEEAVQAA